MVRRFMARTYSNITTLFAMTNYLQMDSVHPMSRPAVKYKRRLHSVKSYRLRMTGHRRCAIMMAHLLVASTAARNGLNQLHFDAESFPIQVDNCCSKCITNNISDMIPTSLVRTSKIVKGFKGEQCAATCRGTIKWSWEDDMGEQHTFLIPNSFYVPQAISRLLCPQHWAQEAADHRPMPHGTGCDTHDKNVTLYWSQRTKKRTIPLDPSLNVGILYSSSGYQTSDAKCQALEASLVEHGILCCNDMGFNPNDDDAEEEGPEFEPQISKPSKGPSPLFEALNQIHFDLQGPVKEQGPLPPIDIDEEDNINEPVPSRMLRDHHRLSHLPFSRMRSMARAGTLPRAYATCREPICSSCLYGKATRRPWRTKSTTRYS